MNKKELRQLSKSELINLFLNEREARLKLEKRLEEIESLLKAFDNPHTPSSKVRSKKNTERDESKPRFPGKPKGSNGGGIQMPQPDKEEFIKKDSCPECGKKLGKPYDMYKFRQMDIPEPRFLTTQFIVELYKCRCGAEVDAGEDMQKGFYGPNITALLGCLKDECLSYEAIARLLHSVYTLPITNVTVYNKLIQLACLMRSERECIRNAINESDNAAMDETGLRKDGKNGQVWNVSTALHCLFEYDKSRGAEVAKRILSNFSGALVTDDYKGYHWYALHQLCWAHLLREAKEFAEKYDGAKAQYKRLKTLYDKARRAQEMQDSSKYDTFVWELEDIARCYHPLDGCKTMYSKLHNRTHLWLLGAKMPNVPLTSNRAERCLRKVVLHRNRIGCIRNENGEEFVNTFLTCTSTWKIQGKNIYQELLKYSLLT
jgi:hypothetical protein